MRGDHRICVGRHWAVGLGRYGCALSSPVEVNHPPRTCGPSLGCIDHVPITVMDIRSSRSFFRRGEYNKSHITFFADHCNICFRFDAWDNSLRSKKIQNFKNLYSSPFFNFRYKHFILHARGAGDVTRS